MNSASTQRLLSVLSDTASYPHRPEEVTMIQTHASWIFIASPLVYKVKKPVNLGFLDFSSLELRHADCVRELDLNRRLAADIYLDVEPIVERDGGLHLGGEGVVVEWALKMSELDPRYFLKRLLKENAVGVGEMDRIAEKLCAFYLSQPPLPNEEVTSASEHLRQSIDDTLAGAARFTHQTVSPQALEAVTRYVHTFMAQHRELLASRMCSGWIRDCHGDLHMEHMHLSPEAVRIYDCIEFNTRFRHIDLACDIAFLAMDLDFNERPDLARHVVAECGRRLKDEGMTPLMDFYKCYRACVRGTVESLHAVAETVGEDERAAALALAQRYFSLALRYALAGSKPQAFVFMGKVASGKSALAEALSKETGWTVASSDRVRKTLANVELHHRSSAKERDELYAPAMTNKTYEHLFERAIEVLRGGHSVIIDATFSRQAQRQALLERLAAAGHDAIWIVASASAPVVRERLLQRDHAEAVVSDARLEDYQRLSAGYQSPDELPPASKVSILTDGGVEQSLGFVITELAERGASVP